MPIYEYVSEHTESGCIRCARGFEALQSLRDPPIECCPECGVRVKRIISRCRAAVVEPSPENARVERILADYERAGMWSHAAELADKHSARSGNPGLQERALEDYGRAGYDVDSLTSGLKGSDGIES